MSEIHDIVSVYKQPYMSITTQTERYVDDLLQFMGTINWDDKGIEIEEKDIDDSHPFKLVYESLSLIKQDFDAILSERDKAEKDIAEQNRYNKLRAEIWKIASDKSLQEDVLIQKLLDQVGPAIGLSRVCYNKFSGEDPDKSDLVCVVEWCDEGVKPTIGAKVSNALIKHFVNKDFFLCTPETAAEMIPKPFRTVAKPLITAFIKTQDLEYLSILPHNVNNKLEGWFSFEVCKDNKNRLTMTADTRHIISEMVGIVSNHITQKQTEEALVFEQHLLTSLMDNVPDHIYFKDTESRFIRINKAFSDTLGLSAPEQITGKTDFDLFTEEHARPAYEDEQQIIKTGKLLVGIEEKETWQDNRETWVSTTKLPLFNREEQIIGTFGISRDITVRKRAEEALRRAHDELEIKVRERTAELLKANEALQQRNRELLLLNQVGQMFSSSIELDHVLDTALGEIQRLLDAFSTSFWLIVPKTDELACMQAKGPGSENLAHWRLALGQGITGWAAQQDESVLIADALADERHVREVDERTGVIIRSMLSIPLRAKGNVIGVLNLVDSRVGHFTQNDLLMLEPIAAAAAIAIENARLYTQAQQEIAERKRADARLLAAHSISEAKNAAQKALTPAVLATLPDELRTDLTDKHKSNILIVDDTPGNLSILTQMLGDLGYQVRSAINGRAALEAVQEMLPDLILLDIMMPDMSGYDVCKQLKADQRTRDIPVIFISAMREMTDKIKGFSLGGVDYITKPLRGQEVLARVETHLTLRTVQRQLEEKNVRLEQEIIERKQVEEELHMAKEQAEFANRAKSEFIANMSHEIRTPMNAILGFTEILLSKVENPQHKNYLTSVHSSGKVLLDLINDVLDLSKIEAGRLELQLEPVNIKELFNELKLIFLQKFQEKGVEFHADVSEQIPEGLVLDEIRLRQVLINLIANAIKFTEKGEVSLRVYELNELNELKTQRLKDSKTQKTQKTVLFEVKDTGIGIPDEQQAVIFESFRQQNGQKARKYGGTGLGLTITKKLVEMMRGSIFVESKAGQGSLFRVVLSDVEVIDTVHVPEKLFEPEEIYVEFEPAAILIVDDVQSNRDLVQGYLETTDFSIIEASSAEIALELLDVERPDLILMDLRMPGKSGYEVTEILKANDEFKHIPVIALTASVMKATEAKIMALFDGYLRKPVSRRQLLSELKRFLAHKTGTKKEVPAETFEEAGKIIPEEVKARLPEMMEILETSFMPRWAELNEMLMMDDVKTFAAQLKELAQEYRMQPLIDYSKNLHDQAQGYNVDEVEKLIASFPKLIDSLSV